MPSGIWVACPSCHQTDRLTSGGPEGTDHPEEFTQRYTALLKHYDLEGQKTQVSRGAFEKRGHPHAAILKPVLESNL